VRTAGVVADFVEASREVEGARRGVPAGVLPAVVVEDDADAGRAARLIRAKGAGAYDGPQQDPGQGAPAADAGPPDAGPPEALRGDRA